MSKLNYLDLLNEELRSSEYSPSEKKVIRKFSKNLKLRASKVSLFGGSAPRRGGFP